MQPLANLQTIPPASRPSAKAHEEHVDPNSRLVFMAWLSGAAGFFTGLAMFAAIGLATTF